MPLSAEIKKEIISKYGKNDVDSGSPEVQIALLTQRIRDLTEHLKIHKKDKHTRHGLVKLVSQRKKLIKYLIRSNPEAYPKLIKDLGIRG
jgi:small subunit ribosomal protein S15